MGRLTGSEPFGATPIADYSGLKLEYLKTMSELYEAEFSSIVSGTAKYFLKTPSIEKLMNRTFLFRIHRDMLSTVWTWAGSKRKSNLNVGVDKYQIDIELEKLIRDFAFWQEINSHPIEVSAKIHHKLVYIHPFENGNGRWARIVTNLFLKSKINKMIQWPEQEIYVNDHFRSRYIDALRESDYGNYLSLITIHRELIA